MHTEATDEANNITSPCPEKSDQQYFGRNFDKFKVISYHIIIS